MLPLASEERRVLLDLARQAITEAVHHQRVLVVPLFSGELAQPAGVFVTLRWRRRLRGCIGQVEPVDPLAQAVARCAMAAAIDDPRFEPVHPVELLDLEIEISRLSLLRSIAPHEIEIGQHGLLVTRGHQRGLLLPQVATQFRWSAERFLEETCLKGGLEREAWKEAATRLEAFTAEIFSDEEFRAEPQARAG